MKNKYASRCFVCGDFVEIGQGETNMFNGVWKTRHEGNPNCIRKVFRPAPVQPHLSIEEEMHNEYIMDNFTSAEFEDAMGIGWDR